MESLITENDILEESKESFLTYAEEVLTDRAIPNAEDGLLSVQRKILWTMEECLKMTSKGKYKKSASIVGTTLASSYFHGDSSCYGALCKLTQPYLMRYPLIDGDGNLGTQEGNGMEAASRYTNAKPSKYADLMMIDFKKEVVPLKETYNGEYYEPIILPSIFPNALVNGKETIAIGMSHNSLPNNLSEVCDGIVAYIQKGGEITTKEMMHYIKGPDFPLANTIINAKDIYEGFNTGRSKVSLKVRGEYEIKDNKIIFTTIPYRTYRNKIKEQIVKNIDELEKYIEDFRDESNLGKNRLVFVLSQKTTAEQALNKLFELTDLQTTLSYNMNYIVEGTPKLCSIIDLIKAYVNHQNNIMINAAKFDRQKALDRIHILEGLLKAVDKIDDVIRLIKAAENKVIAEKKLIEFLNIDNVQAKAILDMKLGRLTKINKQELIDELNEKQKTVKECNRIIKEQEYRDELLIEKIKKIKKEYGDERRTKIIQLEEKSKEKKEKEEKPIEIIKIEDCVITYDDRENLNRISPQEIKVQKRGGKGVKNRSTVLHMVLTNTADYILIFTSKGNMCKIPVDDIPQSKNGISIRTIAELEGDEKVVTIASLQRRNDFKHIVLFTKLGLAKKGDILEYTNIKKKKGKPIPVIKLNEGDSIANVSFIDEGDACLFTKNGHGIRFDLNELRDIKRPSKGSKVISLKDEDCVVSAFTLKENEEKYIALIKTNCFGKRFLSKEIPKQKKGGVGSTFIEKNSSLVKALFANDDDRVQVIGNKRTINIKGTEIPKVVSRSAIGNKLINDEYITNAINV